MSYKGIDHIALTERNIKKTRATIGAMLRIGFRAGGLGERTKTLLYKLFIRPQLEYGMAIIPHNTAAVELLEQVQYAALRTMLSMPQGYPRHTLRALATCPSMRIRVDELRAGWFFKVERCGADTFMIGLAYKAHQSKPSSKSVFWTATKLPLVLEVRKLRLTEEKQMLPKCGETVLLKKNLRMAAFKSPIPGALTLHAEMTPTQLYSLERLPHQKKQLLLRWIGGKAICLPTLCPVCLTKGAQGHWSACHN